MKPGRRRSRAKWIAILCALAAVGVGLAGARHGVLFVRESRAIAALQSKDEGVQAAALRELAKRRTPRGVAAILRAFPPEEKSAVMHWGVRYGNPLPTWCGDPRALTILKMGPFAIPVLGRMLASPDGADRFWALAILLRFGEKGRLEADPALHFLLDDSDEDVRAMAAFAVGLSASKDPRRIESLIADLKGLHSSEHLRTAAAWAIRTAAAPYEARETFECVHPVAGEKEERSPEMTSAMRSAARTLLQAADTSSDRLWYSSLEALLVIRRRWSLGDLDLTKGVQAYVCRGLAQEKVLIRLLAIGFMDEAYGSNLDKATEAVPSLVASADGKYPELTAKAMEALAMISRDDSIPLSIRALAHEERGVRDAAITALWTVGSAASRALPALRRLREEEKDFEVAERATTLVRRLEFEEGRPPEAQR